MTRLKFQFWMLGISTLLAVNGFVRLFDGKPINAVVLFALSVGPLVLFTVSRFRGRR